MTTNIWLRRFTKLTCGSTIFLIFAGGMVKSTESGLAVPDWPLSYGMVFPPMVGGVFYEHGHRMIASVVGLFVLILAIWLGFKETRRWVRYVGFSALFVVVLQGILGGMTVLHMLPTWISMSHGILAQTFFLLTIFIAYVLSKEFDSRQSEGRLSFDGTLIKTIMITLVVIFIQLFLGALMRHTQSGLAISDFPKMGGVWFPKFDQAMLEWINSWHFDEGSELVNMKQVVYHFMHRIGAVCVTVMIVLVNLFGLKSGLAKVKNSILVVDFLLLIQITLGIATIWTLKSPLVTSFHVVTGAAILGMTFLLLLRAAPIRWNQIKGLLK